MDEEAGAHLCNNAVQSVLVYPQLDQACFDSSQASGHMVYKVFLVLPTSRSSLSTSASTIGHMCCAAHIV